MGAINKTAVSPNDKSRIRATNVACKTPAESIANAGSSPLPRISASGKKRVEGFLHTTVVTLLASHCRGNANSMGVKEADFELEHPELSKRVARVNERHRYNQRIGLMFLAYVIFLLLVVISAYLFASEAMSSFATIASFFALIFGGLGFGRLLKKITIEEHTVADLDKARRLLTNYDSSLDDKATHGKVSKALRKSAERFANNSTSQDSSLLDQYKRIRTEFSDTIDKKVGYVVETSKTNEDIEYAKSVVETLLGVLLNPTIEGVKTFNENAEPQLPTRPIPVPRKIEWGKIAERRMAQLTLAALVSFSLLLVAYFSAEGLGMSPIDFFRTNLAILLVGVFTAFVGFLAWLGRR